MATIDEFCRIAAVEGVKNFILVRDDGEIAAWNMETPEKIADMVLRCGRNPERVGTARYRYLVFRRKSGEHFFIFPVGNYYLGVVKEKEIDSGLLVDGVLNFIAALPRKRPPAQSSAKVNR